jgi:co-chaperonin GroES (HSP10)
MAIFDLKDRKVRAVNKRIVVQKAVRPKQSAGGIILPDEDVRVYCEGKVLSVGPKCESGVQVGDHIIWAVFKGQAAGHHDESRWAIEDDDVIGVLEA